MRYHFNNDIRYLLKSRIIVLLLLFIVPFAVFLVNSYVMGSLITLFNFVMGTNLNIKSFSILEIAVYIFNITVYLFLAIDLYIKDIRYRLDYIFLRENVIKFIIKKSFVFIIILIILKAMQYVLIGGIIALKINQYGYYDLLRLMVSDCLYTMILQFSCLLLYLLFITFRRTKYIVFPIIIMIAMYIPKSIYSVKEKNFEMVVMLIFIIICFFSLLIKYHKNIFENI